MHTKVMKNVRAGSSFLYIISSAGPTINNASFRNLTASNTFKPILTVYKFGRYFGGVLTLDVKKGFYVPRVVTNF